MKHIPSIIKQAAKDLRNNSTKSEIILWNHIKQEKLGVKFLRQKPIYVYTENSGLDRFIIADFYCAEKKMVIELDGSIHAKPEICLLDEQKERLLKSKGIVVMRFGNSDIEINIKKVLGEISLFLKGSTCEAGEGLRRCTWVNPSNELYVKYHDKEWGVPVYDDTILFEFLVLEGTQAGLSWETVLKKRENYREALDSFDVQKIVKYDENKISELLQNEGIIRNKLKVRSVVKNAKVFIEIQKEFGSFSKYIWNFVGGKPVVNTWKNISEVPATTELSDTISKDLKNRGMSFVGSTIMYAYMQAVGMVNDHTTDCFRYKEV